VLPEEPQEKNPSAESRHHPAHEERPARVHVERRHAGTGDDERGGVGEKARETQREARAPGRQADDPCRVVGSAGIGDKGRFLSGAPRA
jgi:hypothetical protein